MGVVLPTGKVLQLYAPEESIMREYVVPRSKDAPPTIYMLCGDWILAIPSAIFVLCFIGYLSYKWFLGRKQNQVETSQEVQSDIEA